VTTLHLIPGGLAGPSREGRPASASRSSAQGRPPAGVTVVSVVPDPVRYLYARHLMGLLPASESVASDLASRELLWLVGGVIVADAISYPLDMLVEAAAVDEGFVPCGRCRAWGHRDSMTGSDFVGWRCGECGE
jgi:hypothetical protein